MYTSRSTARSSSSAEEGTDFMTLLSTDRVYAGRIVSLDVDTVRFPNGTVGELEMLRHPGAAAVVPFLDDPRDADPRILLIRQFRHATGGYLWEIPAGRRDGDEAPELTARRELREETGYRCTTITELTWLWTTPGFTDERIHLFSATGLERRRTEPRGGRDPRRAREALVGGTGDDPQPGNRRRQDAGGTAVGGGGRPALNGLHQSPRRIVFPDGPR